MPRAKFRCMSVTRDTCGSPFHPSSWRTEARLIPIKAFPNYDRDGDPNIDPDHAKENADFWKYTPSGECCWYHNAELGVPYYIDMVPDPDGDWKAEEYTLSESYLNVTLKHMTTGTRHRKGQEPEPYEYGTGEFFQMGVNIEEASEGAWKPFVDAGPGSRWKLTFTRTQG